MIIYQCPECGTASPSAAWNNATCRDVHGIDWGGDPNFQITPIEAEEEETYHVCPACDFSAQFDCREDYEDAFVHQSVQNSTYATHLLQPEWS